MAQFDIYPNPGSRRAEIPFLVAVQNDHISSRTGACVVIPLRAQIAPVEIMAPLVEVPGHGPLVLSADEIFAIETTRLRHPVGSLNTVDRAKVRPAIDKVVGEY
jgi:mRNA-degrading endonuclease toxin of MazEF toxin-antitoxin module